MKNERKKSKIKFLGVKLNDIIRVGTMVGACISVALYLDSRFDSIEQTMDHRFDRVEQRLDKVEQRLDNIETKLDQTSTLLNRYLTWRFIYINDPQRKHLVPVYDPLNKTLDFVDKKANGN